MATSYKKRKEIIQRGMSVPRMGLHFLGLVIRVNKNKIKKKKDNIKTNFENIKTKTYYLYHSTKSIISREKSHIRSGTRSTKK